MISVNRHTQQHLQEISSLFLKPDTHKENIEAEFLQYCISEWDPKLSPTNLLFTQRCTNENNCASYKWVHLFHQATGVRYDC